MRDKRTLGMAALLTVVALACAPAAGDAVRDGPAASLPSRPGAPAVDLPGLVEAAEQVRSLQFARPPTFELVDRTEPAPAASPTAAEADRAAFSAALVGLLGADVGAGQQAGDAHARVRAGEPAAYDPVSRTVLVARLPGEPTPYARVAIVRQILLALLDERFGYEETAAAALDRADGDEAAALRALAEGDAEYFSGLFAERHLTSEERLAVQLESLNGASAGPVPVAELRRGAGAAFVRELVSAGGVEAVDTAYAAPPITSEQVYHPARYAAGEASLDVRLPEHPVPAGYRSMGESHWGEAGLRALFADVLTSAEALQASTGWGGDRVATWWDGEDVLVVAVIRGDGPLDTEELDKAMRRWALHGIEAGAGRTDWKGVVFEGSGAYAFVGLLEGDVLLVAASDPAAGRRVRDSFFPHV